jgi:hypothetical protein
MVNSKVLHSQNFQFVFSLVFGSCLLLVLVAIRAVKRLLSRRGCCGACGESRVPLCVSRSVSIWATLDFESGGQRNAENLSTKDRAK